VIIDGRVWSDLRLFLEVARWGSFNKAAPEVDATHPKLARAVRRLEKALGTVLVVASERGVTLTERGQTLAKDLEKIDRRVLEALARSGR
jgi:DNA-binding transcriptional LysR family regulator